MSRWRGGSAAARWSPALRLTLSPGWAQLLGYGADEHVPADGDWTRWVHPDDQARVQHEGAAYVAASDGAFRTILRTRAKDGTWRSIEVRGQLTQLDGGPHLVGGLVDVTEPERTRVELARKARALRLLTDTNQAMMRARDEAALLAVACQVAVAVGGYRMAWVGLVDPTHPGAVRPVAQAGFDEGYVAASDATWADGRGPAATAIASDAPCIVRDIPTAPAFAERRDDAAARGYRSAAALPVHVGGAVAGVFKVYSSECDAFDDAERAILTELVEDLSFALAVRTAAERDRAERELRTLLDSFPDLIARFDREGRVTYVGASVLRTGQTTAVIGRTPYATDTIAACVRACLDAPRDQGAALATD